MNATLSLRLDEKLRDNLRARAAALGVSEADVVRRALEREVRARPLGERVRGLRGSVELPKNPADSLRVRLRERNWRT